MVVLCEDCKQYKKEGCDYKEVKNKRGCEKGEYIESEDYSNLEVKMVMEQLKDSE